MARPRLISSQHGVALIEFALALPLLLILFIGLVETAYLTLHYQKIDKLSSSMSDFVTQGSTISRAELDSFGLAVPQIMRPFTFSGTVIFSSASRILRPNGGTPAICRNRNPCVDWQYSILGSDPSQIGAPNSPPTLPGGYQLIADQGVIVAEVYLNYRPVLAASANFISGFRPKTLYKASLTKPRQGALTTLQ